MSLNPPIQNWRGQRVWLMGASSGIGAALATELARQGAQLVLSARREDVLAELLQSLPGQGHLALPCDVTDAPGMLAACARIEAAWGGLDFAFYLAGDYKVQRAWDFSPAVIRQLCEINYLGAVNFADCVLPLWLKQAPKNPCGLILVSSVAGYRGLPKALGYGPAKAALIQFAETLYLDLKARKIGVWLVNPGFVATRLTEKNDFKMPALISTDEAVTALLKGLAEGGFEIDFPKRFTRLMKLLRWLPYSLYFRLVGKTTGE
ncbi:MAG TPA: SDR family NAD(P)-dependent oxidoreductase [Rhodocyclaceae bacterium]|jgi:NAD(P)-dependent dehydrogenase (short-subunit alcohol dehydrogenase family)|nr:SDR family NAD(P)-dependent oxidoreductase [Rhodocyclaceae bacterium]